MKSRAWIADTPGFSTVDFMEIEKEDLPHLFPEFVEVEHECINSESVRTNMSQTAL